MIPILYEASESSFTSNGVARLAEATECTVTEERNGEYELTLTYPVTGKHFELIQEGMYIAATHDDKGDRQAFRIYRRSAPLNGLVQFYAHHISYLLRNIILNPITATSAADAFDQMEQDTVTANPFTMWTDVTTSGTFKTDTPVSIRSVLGGSRGSILDVYGGEYEFSMYTVKLHARRGIDSGATIRYGKNMTDLSQVVDAGSIYNAIVPFWLGTVNDVEVLVTLPEHYVIATGATNPIMTVMDFSNEFREKPTVAQLRAKASAYLSSNRPWIPTESIKISFVQLWQTEEYKNVAALQRLSLCDSVSVYYPEMGITAEGVKIIKAVYNVLLDRYDSMELGDARSSFAETIGDTMGKALEAAEQNFASKSYMQSAIEDATQQIVGGMGGNIVITLDANGWPIELLMMDTKDKSTAVNVWRWNLGGFGHSHDGYDGPFSDFAITQDGKINANFITVGTMLANRIKGGTLSLGGGTIGGDGVMIMYNVNNSEVGRWDKDQLALEYGMFKINGTYPLSIGKESVSYIDDSGAYPALVSRDVYGMHIGSGSTKMHYGFTPSGSAVVERGTQKHVSMQSGNYYAFEDITPGQAEIGTYDSSRDRMVGAVVREYSTGEFFGAYIMTDAMNGNRFTQWLIYATTTEISHMGHQLAYASSSSKRYKHDIAAITDEALDPHKLYDLPVRQFTYNEDAPVQYEDMRDKTIPGFVAEEVAEIYPAAVIYNKDGAIESWDERRIIPGMLALIQEQKKQIYDLQARVDRLEAIIARLEV